VANSNMMYIPSDSTGTGGGKVWCLRLPCWASLPCYTDRHVLLTRDVNIGGGNSYLVPSLTTNWTTCRRWWHSAWSSCGETVTVKPKPKLVVNHRAYDPTLRTGGSPWSSYEFWRSAVSSPSGVRGEAPGEAPEALRLQVIFTTISMDFHQL